MPAPPSTPPRGRVTAEGVFAELAVVKPQLEKHQQILASKLIPPLAERAKNIISGLKTDIKSEQTLEQVASEVATETVRQSFENLGKLQDKAQIPQVLADSLTSSIVTHPNVNFDLDKVIEAKKPLPSADEEKIYKKAQKEVAEIAKDQATDLEKAAVLQHLASLADQSAKDIAPQIVEEEAANFVRENDLPDPENAKATLKGRFPGYTLNFAQILTKEIVPQISEGNVPTLAQYQQARTQAADRAISTLKANIGAGEGQPDISPFLHSASQLVGFEPASADTLRKIGVGDASPKISTFARSPGSVANFGIGIALATHPGTQREGFFSLISGKTSQKITQQLQSLKTTARKRALTFRERKDYYKAAEQQQLISQSQSFGQQQAVKKSGLVSTFLRAPMLARLDWVNNSWQTVTANSNGYSGVFVPSIPARRMASIMPTRFFGGQAARLGNFAKGAQSAVKVGGLAGKFAPPALIIGASVGMLKKIIPTVGGYIFGLMLKALFLGKAALAGAMIGGAVGGAVGLGAGAFIGFQLALLCGPLAVACGIATVPAFAIGGGLIGGAIGATAGMLIGYGLASGSTTAVSMGVGAGIGGTAGGIGGFMLGNTIAVGLDAIAAALCSTVIGCLIGAPLAVFGHFVVVPFFTVLGAAVGTAIGAYVGYLVGHYVIPAFGNFFGGLSFSIPGFGVGGLFGTAGSFLTGLGSTIWGGMISAGGGIFGGLSSIGGALFGGLGSGSTVGLAALSVGGAFTIPAAITIFVGIPIAATFFNPDQNNSQLVGGNNEFFSVTKSANVSSLQNTDLPKTVTFTIHLEAKDKNLTAIQISDQINVTGRYASFSQTPNIFPRCTQISTLAAGQPWDCQFDFEIINSQAHNYNYNDSQLINTVTIKATPEGASQIQDSAAAAITIGNPPASCPRGWPTTGDITQGPEGISSHDEESILYPGIGMEALDIAGGIGVPVYATFNGTVININRPDSPLNKIVHIAVTGCGNLQLVSYIHLRDVNVSDGSPIAFGDLIGTQGNPGTGAHLHYQFNGDNNRSVNIIDYIPISVPRNCDDSSTPTCDVNISPPVP